MLIVFSILFAVSIIAIQLFVTISGKDAWPFSSYDMFSEPLDIAKIGVFRVALERQNGEIVWWRSHFYRYPQHVGKQIKRLYRLGNDNTKTKMVVALETRKTLIEVARLIRIEEGGLDGYQAFHIVERTARADDNTAITFDDKTVVRIPFQDILVQLGESNN